MIEETSGGTTTTLSALPANSAESVAVSSSTSTFRESALFSGLTTAALRARAPVTR
ncbi:MAG: hypothetical protein U0269_25295 [Polyangiales bacterium]